VALRQCGALRQGVCEQRRAGEVDQQEGGHRDGAEPGRLRPDDLRDEHEGEEGEHRRRGGFREDPTRRSRCRKAKMHDMGVPDTGEALARNTMGMTVHQAQFTG
jgi:hypothetical protein